MSGLVGIRERMVRKSTGGERAAEGVDIWEEGIL